MAANSLLAKLREGKVLLGVANGFPAAGIIELLGNKWDFIWVDGQHGQFSYDGALAAVRTAAAVGVDVLLRVPGQEAGFLNMYADMAPAMLMVPMVDTPEQARAIVRPTRFPPLGNRSYGGRRPIDLHTRDYHTLTEVALTAQIETPEALVNVQAIAAVEGVDVLFFSPDDMKLRLGLPINTPTDSKELRPGMEAVAKAAKGAGKFCGCVAGSAAAASAAAAMGYQMIVGGGDAGFIRTVAAEKLSEFRKALGVAPVTTPAAIPGPIPGAAGAY